MIFEMAECLFDRLEFVNVVRAHRAIGLCNRCARGCGLYLMRKVPEYRCLDNSFDFSVLEEVLVR